MAIACARSVDDGAGASSGPTSDHRPAPAGGPLRRSAPGRGRVPGLGRFARAPATYARSGASVSFVTSPDHTSSHSASSTIRSSAVFEAATRSGQNDAPCVSSHERIAA